MKPRIFIGSSSEGIQIAHAIQSNLDPDAEVTVWSQDVFRPGESTLQSLLRQVDQSDFGVFVFSPDDVIEVHDTHQLTVRDNVVFELGLYIGRLGPMRSLVVAPR